MIALIYNTFSPNNYCTSQVDLNNTSTMTAGVNLTISLSRIHDISSAHRSSTRLCFLIRVLSIRHISREPPLWTPFPLPTPCNMSSNSNDQDQLYLIYTYFWVASYVAVVYDWVLIFGQEIDLVWRQHWSIVTVLYLGLRYIGLVLPGLYTWYLLQIPLTNAVSIIMYFIYGWESLTGNNIIGAIMIIRLYSMYRSSKTMLIFLSLIFSILAITSGVIMVKQGIIFIASEELTPPDIRQYYDTSDDRLLTVVTWIFGTVWEVLTLCLAVWVAIKDLRGLPKGWTIGDCLSILIKSHVLYFSSFTMTAALNFGMISPNVHTASSIGAYVYGGLAQICSFMQMFVLGPRLILSIRDYDAKMVANSDEATVMASIIFQPEEGISVSSDSNHIV